MGKGWIGSCTVLTSVYGRMMANVWISLSVLETVGLQIWSQGKHHCILNVHLCYSKITGNIFAFEYRLNLSPYIDGWNVQRSEIRL